jgi:plastocyanin
MKKMLFAIVPLALMLTLALGACGKQAAGGGPGTGTGSTGGGGGGCTTSQTITLTVDNFASSCYTVSANQAVTFDDPSSTGGVHIICTGAQAKCAAEPGAPTDLSAPGFQIQPGQTHQVTFTTAGTYHIACTVHPAMDMTLTVK